MTSGKYVIFLEESNGKTLFLRENLGFTENMAYAKKFDTLELALSADELFKRTRAQQKPGVYTMVLQIPERKLREEYKVEIAMMANVAETLKSLSILGPFVNPLGWFAGIVYFVITGNTRIEIDISNGYISMMGSLNGIHLMNGSEKCVSAPLNEVIVTDALRQIRTV